MGNKSNKQKEAKEDTKIELYPDRKPRYEFKKYSLSYIVPNDALSFFFDKDKKLGFAGDNVPILKDFIQPILIITQLELNQMIFGS